jgi:hypothetical protein
MKFTQLTCQHSNQIGEEQARSKVWVHVKVPSRFLSCESSAALQLFKQSTALLQTNNCRKVLGKQPTGTEQDHSLFSMKFTQVPSQYSNQIGDVQARNKVWVCEGASAAYPPKAVPPFSSTNNQLHSCRLSIVEKCGKQRTGIEQGSHHSLV